MTNTIATFITLNAKRLVMVTALAVALIFSVTAASAAEVPVGGDCTSQQATCESGSTCQLVNNNFICVDSATSGITGDDPAASEFGLTEYKDGIGLGDRPLDDAVVGLINVLLGFLGLIAVIIILIGGFRWMTAGGNEDKVAEARKTIFAGIIGLAIILFAWGITTFVVQQLGKASGVAEFQGY